MPKTDQHKLSIVKCIRFTPYQIELMDKLVKYNVDVNYFIRTAFEQKLNNEWKIILENSKKSDVPF